MKWVCEEGIEWDESRVFGSLFVVLTFSLSLTLGGRKGGLLVEKRG
jgi:hypothetical protein